MSGVYRCKSKEKYFRTTVLILGAIIIAVFTIGIVMFITVFSKNNNISADLKNYVYNELPQIRKAEEKRAKLVGKFEEQIYSVGNEENEHLLSQIADATSEITDTANIVNIRQRNCKI